MSPAQVIFICCVIIGALYEVGKWWIKRSVSRHIRDITARRAQTERNRAAYRKLREGIPLEREPGDPYSDIRLDAELIFIPRQRTEDSR